MALKISVLASGHVLADGQAVELAQLAEKLQALQGANGAVWYYREPSSGDPPAQAMEVLKLVVQHKLRISISSKPDFSDYVDSQGVSHPRGTADGGAALRMPAVDTGIDPESTFAQVRNRRGENELVIVRPNRQVLCLPPPDETPALRKVAAGLERLVPADVQRNIAVIADTGFAGGAGAPGLAEAGQAIPFFGLLMGFAFIGHRVWIFEGHASAFAAGCRDADVLIVDGGMLPMLPAGWQDTAAAVLRSANILVHDRANYQLRAVRKLGAGVDRLEFASI